MTELVVNLALFAYCLLKVAILTGLLLGLAVVASADFVFTDSDKENLYALPETLDRVNRGRTGCVTGRRANQVFDAFKAVDREFDLGDAQGNHVEPIRSDHILQDGELVSHGDQFPPGQSDCRHAQRIPSVREKGLNGNQYTWPET